MLGLQFRNGFRIGFGFKIRLRKEAFRQLWQNQKNAFQKSI
jgi:hypothetical protein